jgi:hypothetical protein
VHGGTKRASLEVMRLRVQPAARLVLVVVVAGQRRDTPRLRLGGRAGKGKPQRSA